MSRTSAYATLARTRWDALASREKLMVGTAGAVIAAALVWLIALGPALATLRGAEEQRRAVDAQVERMRDLQKEALNMQSLPKQNYDEAVRSLELSVRQQLGATGRMVMAGDRATVTLTGTAPDILAQWLAQARVNAKVVPNEARLNRNAAGLWEGTLVLALPPR